MELYEGQESAVRMKGGMSDWFPVCKGVRQGCILSPYLFSAYTEMVMRDVMEDQRSVEFDGLKINGEVITDLRYADDTALLSGSEKGFDTLLHSVKEYSDDKGLKLNVNKTKIKDIKRCHTSSKIEVNGEMVKIRGYQRVPNVVEDRS